MGFFLKWIYSPVNLLNFFSGGIFMLFAPKERGQGLVEYALILVLVAVVVIVILALLGPAIGKIFSNVVKAI
jgi:pilus assembly protein Flp/PilA